VLNVPGDLSPKRRDFKSTLKAVNSNTNRKLNKRNTYVKKPRKSLQPGLDKHSETNAIAYPVVDHGNGFLFKIKTTV
jgi:hypothetical protein